MGIVSIPAFAGQDPEMNQQFAAPSDETAIVSYTEATTASGQTPRTAQSMGKPLTGKFTNAKPQEVLNWLQRNGVNFVIESGQIDKDARITLNVENQPREAVVDAISSALGGHFTLRNGIYVFRKGYGTLAPSIEFRSLPRTVLPGRVLPPAAPTAPQIKVRTLNPEDLKAELGPDFAKKMEEMAKKMELNAKEFEKAFGPEFQKSMEERSKVFTKEFGPDFAKKMEEMAKKMEAESKQMEKAFGPEFQKQMEEMGKKMELRMKELDSKGLTQPRILTFSSTNLDELIKSLTNEQKATLKSRGFLTVDDLTSAQKSKLGKLPEGQFEIRVKKDNAPEFVLKSK